MSKRGEPLILSGLLKDERDILIRMESHFARRADELPAGWERELFRRQRKLISRLLSAAAKPAPRSVAAEVNEMVERVALVLFAGELHYTPGAAAAAWATCSHVLRERVRSAARTIIATMREPTEEMFDSLSATDLIWRDLTSRTVWQAMLDGALR